MSCRDVDVDVVVIKADHADVKKPCFVVHVDSYPLGAAGAWAMCMWVMIECVSAHPP